MNHLAQESVLSVQHWTDELFSFRTSRRAGFNFRNGQFVMLGLPGEARPLMRAYSIASPNHAEHLEFFSIKVPDGPLTSRLQNIQPGDPILLSRKPTGSLLLDDVHPGRRLYLLSTGTGLAPFLSLIQDPDIYQKFAQVILAHGVRTVAELAYADFLNKELPSNPYFGQAVQSRLIYYPTVTREPYRNRGRLTDLIRSGQLFRDLGQPELNPQEDRVMLCGSPSMLKECQSLLDARGLQISPHIGAPGDYVIERAFVEN